MSKNDWPQEGDQYWYVNWEYGTASSLLVRSSTYDGVDIDKNRRVIGNCYRTEQAAKRVVALILSALAVPTEPPWNNAPKLTAQIFNRPDCPDWCNAAVVSSCGIAYWVDGDFEKRHKEITGLRFDTTDWQHSLIKRPMTELPDWCKVGAWVYNQRGYYFCKIIEIAKDKKSFTVAQPGKNYTIGSGDLNYGFDKWKPACLRPWTFEDAPLMCKVRDVKNEQEEAVLSLCPSGYYRVGAYSSGRSSFSAVLRKYEQLDGSPCGVLEVTGDIDEEKM